MALCSKLSVTQLDDDALADVSVNSYSGFNFVRALSE